MLPDSYVKSHFIKHDLVKYDLVASILPLDCRSCQGATKIHSAGIGERDGNGRDARCPSGLGDATNQRGQSPTDGEITAHNSPFSAKINSANGDRPSLFSRLQSHALRDGKGRKRRGGDPFRNRQHVGGRQVLPVCRPIRVPGRKIVRESILTTRQGRCLRRVAETEAKGLCQGGQTQVKALSAADETTWRIRAGGDAMRLKLAAFGSAPPCVAGRARSPSAPQTFRTHYLHGEPPFKWSDYSEWMKK